MKGLEEISSKIDTNNTNLEKLQKEKNEYKNEVIKNLLSIYEKKIKQEQAAYIKTQYNFFKCKDHITEKEMIEQIINYDSILELAFHLFSNILTSDTDFQKAIVRRSHIKLPDEIDRATIQQFSIEEIAALRKELLNKYGSRELAKKLIDLHLIYEIKEEELKEKILQSEILSQVCDLLFFPNEDYIKNGLFDKDNVIEQLLRSEKAINFFKDNFKTILSEEQENSNTTQKYSFDDSSTDDSDSSSNEDSNVLKVNAAFAKTNILKLTKEDIEYLANNNGNFASICSDEIHVEIVSVFKALQENNNFKIFKPYRLILEIGKYLPFIELYRKKNLYTKLSNDVISIDKSDIILYGKIKGHINMTLTPSQSEYEQYHDLIMNERFSDLQNIRYKRVQEAIQTIQNYILQINNLKSIHHQLLNQMQEEEKVITQDHRQEIKNLKKRYSLQSVKEKIKNRHRQRNSFESLEEILKQDGSQKEKNLDNQNIKNKTIDIEKKEKIKDLIKKAKTISSNIRMKTKEKIDTSDNNNLKKNKLLERIMSKVKKFFRENPRAIRLILSFTLVIGIIAMAVATTFYLPLIGLAAGLFVAAIALDLYLAYRKKKIIKGKAIEKSNHSKTKELGEKIKNLSSITINNSFFSKKNTVGCELNNDLSQTSLQVINNQRDEKKNKATQEKQNNMTSTSHSKIKNKSTNSKCFIQ